MWIEETARQRNIELLADPPQLVELLADPPQLVELLADPPQLVDHLPEIPKRSDTYTRFCAKIVPAAAIPTV